MSQKDEAAGERNHVNDSAVVEGGVTSLRAELMCVLSREARAGMRDPHLAVLGPHNINQVGAAPHSPLECERLRSPPVYY